MTDTSSLTAARRHRSLVALRLLLCWRSPSTDEGGYPVSDIVLSASFALNKHLPSNFARPPEYSIRAISASRVQREPCAAVVQRAQLRSSASCHSRSLIRGSPRVTPQQQRELYFTWRAVPLTHSSAVASNSQHELFSGEPLSCLESHVRPERIRERFATASADLGRVSADGPGPSSRSLEEHSTHPHHQDILPPFVANPVFLDLPGSRRFPTHPRNRQCSVLARCPGMLSHPSRQ